VDHEIPDARLDDESGNRSGKRSRMYVAGYPPRWGGVRCPSFRPG
jgi:hypothetical protein